MNPTTETAAGQPLPGIAPGSFSHLLERYVTWVVDHRAWVIAAVVLLTSVLGMFASRQEVIINPAAVVPQSHPYIQTTNEIEAIFGSKYLVVIGVTPDTGDALQPRVLDAVARVTDRLLASPTVSRQTLLSLTAPQAKSIQGDGDAFLARPLVPDTSLDAAGRDALREAITANPVFRDTVISSDWRTATIMAELRESEHGYGHMLRDVQRILQEEAVEGLSFSLSGNPVYLREAERLAGRIHWLFPIAVLVIGLLHFEAFRTLQGLVLPLVTAVLSVVWGVGIMGVMGVPMDIFNSPTPILILAVAAGHAVQLLKRYYESYIDLVAAGYAPGPANRLATIHSLAAVGPVLVIAGGVAALGFFSLVIFELETIRAFGIFTGIGLLTAVVLEFTFTPAVRASLRPPSARHVAAESRVRIWDRVTGGVAGAVLSGRGRRRVLLAIAALLAVAVAGWPLVQVDNASRSFFSESLPVQAEDSLLNAQTGGTNVLYLMVDTGVPDGVKDPAVLAAIRALQADAEGREHVGKTLSIDDFLRRMHGAAEGMHLPAATLPADSGLIAQYLFLYSLSGDPEDFSSHVDYDYRRAKVSIMLRTNSNAEIEALVGDLAERAAREFPAGVTVSFGGEVAQTLAVTDVMVRSKLLNILQILTVIFAVSAIAFRSFVGGLLVLSPLLVVLTLVFGAMGYLGVPLNIPNALISAMAVGIGADYAIYLIYRIGEYAGQGRPLEDAVRQAIGTAGKACLYVATAVAGGYAVLLLSWDYKVHVWLASFIGLAMLVAVFTALTLIPSVILAFKPRFIHRQRGGGRGAAVLIVVSAVAFLTYSQVAWSAPDSTAEGPDAVALMEANAAATRFDTAEGEAAFELRSASGATRLRRATLQSRLHENGVDTLRLVRFHAPADIRGTATLLVEHSDAEDDMWVYLPAMRRIRRLVASNRKDSFIGTDFSYGDVMGHRVEDWSHRWLRDEEVDGVLHHVVESVPASTAVLRNSGYSRRTSWLRVDNRVATRVEVDDLAGEPFKRFEFEDIRAMGVEPERWQPMRATGTNLHSGHRTRIEFTRFEVGVDLPAALFTPHALDRP